jgi:hypothetical protein
MSANQPSSGAGGFCRPCRSHFCPHVAAHLYRPPFTEEDELDGATATWEEEASRFWGSRLDHRIDSNAGDEPADERSTT